MMPPENRPVSKLAKETGLSEATLYKWKEQARATASPGILPLANADAGSFVEKKSTPIEAMLFLKAAPGLLFLEKLGNTPADHYR